MRESANHHELTRKRRRAKSGVSVAPPLRYLNSCLIALALLLTSCSASRRCSGDDLGGWIVYDEPTFGVHHYCVEGSERFVLQEVERRRPDGSVGEWAHVATLDVRLRRHEETMFGFECGSNERKRGDVIAVVRYRRDGSFEVTRVWLLDPQTRTFIVVSAHRVMCESIE